MSSVAVHGATATIAAGSLDGHVRSYDVRMGRATADRLCGGGGGAVTSVALAADGGSLLASCLDGRLRLVDRADGRLLRGFGGDSFRNEGLRIRSMFAAGDGLVVSGSEPASGEDEPARVFAWDVVTGARTAVVAVTGAGRGRVASCLGWNERGQTWAAGCSDGEWLVVAFLWLLVAACG